MTVTDARTTDEERVDRLVEALLAEHDPKGDRVEFLGAQYDLGLAWVHFPEGFGGLGLSPKLQRRIQERIAAAGGPGPAPGNPIGYGMAAPTVVTHAKDDQKRRWLRPLFTSEEIWCQMFSEPGAGSDLAGLSTRAVRDGEEWIVNGQKVWTSLAHLASWGLLVARTDPNVPKHRGLTYFIVDMSSPGVDVRPLRQMTGQAEFNEVYFTDLRIPDERRISDEGDGWRVSLTTLMNERVSIGGNVPPRGSGVISAAVRAWQKYGHDDPARKDELMKLWVRAEALRLTAARASDARKAGNPGPEGSISKLMSAELNMDVHDLVVELMGLEGTLYGDYTMDRSAPERSTDPVAQYLRSRANSIEGGSSEVMRNILGERMLGLPGDVRVDKDRAWIEVPRS